MTAIVAALFLSATFARVEQPRQPNIVVCPVGRHSLLDWTAYASTDVKTLARERLAKAGTRFDRASRRRVAHGTERRC